MNDMCELPADDTAAAEDSARADHYALLARLFFAAPDAGLLAGIGAAGARYAAGSGALADAWQALGKAAAQSDCTTVAEEFDRLFVSVGRQEVMVYGSFYQTGFLMEEPLAELRDDLAALGLGRRAGIAETEDHIAALAEVMRHLIVTGPDDAGLARQHAFFSRHLEPWVDQLSAALAAHPEAVFYSCVAALARAFFAVESEAFAALALNSSRSMA